jgi:acyl-CoA thioester hydrolase
LDCGEKRSAPPLFGRFGLNAAAISASILPAMSEGEKHVSPARAASMNQRGAKSSPLSVFSYSHRVTYAECAVGNHIYYARYLDLLEAARGEFFRYVGTTFLQWQERDTIFPVIEAHQRYKSPARYDDVLKIELWIAKAKGVRLTFAYRITNQAGKPVLEAETLHVCTSVSGRPKRLPEELIACETVLEA